MLGARPAPRPAPRVQAKPDPNEIHPAKHRGPSPGRREGAGWGLRRFGGARPVLAVTTGGASWLGHIRSWPRRGRPILHRCRAWIRGPVQPGQPG